MTTITINRVTVEQALEALEWHYRQGHSNTIGGFRLKIDEKALRELRAALAQQAEPVQDQDVEDAIEAAYWQFDCRKKGLNEWASAPQSERDAFKAEARKLVRGYFPTRQAQDTKREMLAVADAFIRGKRAALAQQAEPVEPVAQYSDIVSDGGMDPRNKYDTAPPQRTMVPLTEEEILAAVGWERAAMYMKLTPSFPVDEAKKETLTNARAVEKASWEKNRGQT